MSVSPAQQTRGHRSKQLPDAKQCKACGQWLPIRHFAPTGNYIKSLGRKRHDSTCRQCRENERRAAGKPVRMPKEDGRGNVWCARCKRYLPAAEFKPHPYQDRQKWWAYCKPCVLEIDRIRHFKKHSDPAAKRADNDRHNELRRIRRRNDFRERRDYLASAIDRIGRRGLTRSEIFRLTGINMGNLIAYAAKEINRPDPNTVERMMALDLATNEWPVGDAPAFRRRLPHPRLDELEAVMAPVRQRYPGRDIWRNRR